MAPTSTNRASSSSTPTRKSKYDVFLSFRGEDTRKNFVDHLFAGLSQSGIYTFKDDEQLRTGEEFSPELLKAIEESSIALIVFSKRYASSKWCLDELVKILGCKEKMGQTVVPIFYGVDPSQVRKQTGSFAAAFKKHEEGFDGKMQQKVQRWKTALEETANIAGHNVQDTANGYESRCIQQIIEDIFSKLNHLIPIVADDLIGIESSVEEVKSLLHMELNDVHSIGLWGMGGIGKTTIAQAVFDRISQQFDGRCFLANVREFSKKKGLEALQKRLLSDILYRSNIKITSVCRGLNMIKNRLCHRRVLVVADDVDQLEQLQALGKVDWFGSGSRIIITTRDEHLLTTYGVTKIYNVKALECGEALQLLSWKAFHQRFPSEGYLELSNQVVDYVRGLPLALIILGSFLHGRTTHEWKSTMSKLHKIPNKEILQVLKISFDGLDEMQQEIFLDIACFYKGEDKSYVERILESCGFFPGIEMPVLIEKSLITISENRLCMHDLIQGMGWYIVDQESPEEAGKRSRLWRPKDIRSVLAENKGTEKVKGIVLELFAPEDIDCSTEAFTKMTKLRVLILHNVLFSSGPAHLSNKLKWLDWHAYPSSYLPASFRAENLVELKMSYSRIVQLWKEIKPLPKLEVINLSHSHRLSRTPDFTVVPKLTTLILEDCISLEEVHPSLGALKRLVLLNLRDCTNLKKFPSSIHSKYLETFILSGFLKLEKFPEILWDMVHLSELYLDRTAIKEVPSSSIEHLTSLTLLDLSECKNLSSLPENICGLSCLKTLKLSGCSKLEELPERLGNLKCLVELHANKTGIKRLPSSITLLKELKVLSLSGCRGTMLTQSSSWFLPRKREDSVCLVLPSLTGLYSLTELDLSDCNLSEGGIPNDLGSLASLIKLNLSRNSFVSLPASISRLSQLKTLVVEGCKRLKALPELPSSIFILRADDCQSLISIGDLSTKYDRSLGLVAFSNCFKLLQNKGSEKMVDMLLMFALQFAIQRNRPIVAKLKIILPGREIPEWFRHRHWGKKASVQLPPDWYERILGIAVCVVFEFLTENTTCRIFTRFVDHNNKSYLAASQYCGMPKGTKVDSGHIWLTFFSNRTIKVPRGKSLNELCQFEVFLHVYGEFERTPERKWGVRLVYEKDVISWKDGFDEFNASACSDYSDSDSESEITLYRAQCNGGACSDSDSRDDDDFPQHHDEEQGNESACSDSHSDDDDYDHDEAQGNGSGCSHSDSDSNDESPHARRDELFYVFL
ncbi:TMV resistance protein N-like [Cornus florida]|uniref:TMV resistance protein N-like n=1 Tax=Cornus florida TaxID=4283 RepID=UPI00289E48FB|nr:TMV resistance protein N-like [Cornus florida]